MTTNFTATYLGQTLDGIHYANINGHEYTFKFNGQGGAVSFRDESGKVVARTYKSFKQYLKVKSGTYQANLLVQATAACKIHHKAS